MHWSEFDKEQTQGEHLWEYPFRTRLPGCDTTSRLFVIGRAAGFTLVKETFREQAEVLFFFRFGTSFKLNIVVPAHACGNKLKVVIMMLICIGPYTV